MAKASTKAKMKYNRSTYKRYEFNLNVDSKINALVERYKSYPDSNLSYLLKNLLCRHFGITIEEGDSFYAPYYVAPGGDITPNDELDQYFLPDSS